MPQYRYEGFDSSGGRVSGSIDSSDSETAKRELRSRGIILKQLTDEASSVDLRVTLGFSPKSVGLADLEFLTAELALLLESGVKIDRAIGILRRSASGVAMSALLGAVTNDLKQGKQFSEAAAAHPQVFDSLYVNLLALGEASGRLPEVFQGLSSDLRFRRELRQKIVSASIYPAVVAAVCIAALIFILNFVVPNLKTIFSDTELLPWYTRALLGASDFMISWQGPMFLLLTIVMTLAWRSRKSPRITEIVDRLLLDFPLVRDANLMVERIRFSSGLALMLKAGLPVDRALALATGNIGHAMLRREMTHAVDKVRRGEQISTALRMTRLFPDYFVSLLEVGEEGGALAKVFSEISSRSRDDFSAYALRVTTLLEPLLVLLMGLIVGGVVVIMMLSITSVADIGV